MNKQLNEAVKNVADKAFVYCWTDHLTGKLYIGSHKGTIDDGYVCSSKLMKLEFTQRPHDFTRQIIAEGCVEDIRNLEMKMLQSIDAARDDKFYNMHNGQNGDGFISRKGVTGTKYNKHKEPRSEDHRHKLSEGLKNNQNAKCEHPWISKRNAEKVQCPYCDKVGGFFIMQRYHFNRCKNKP